MQFQVGNAIANPVPFNLEALKNKTIGLPAAFAASQDLIIVPEIAYGAAINKYARIQDTSFTFTPTGSTTPITIQMQPKAIQELFELNYGRMNSTLGVELPLTNILTQTTIPYGYIDPPTEVINATAVPGPPVAGDGTQIWKITHNGVDTHAIHFHLFDVQLINRVDWAGVVKPPDANELGWKDTVRMNPLEDAIVALRPITPKTPFGVPDSVRPLDPTMPLGSTTDFTNVDPITGNPVTTINSLFNFGWEYVWHCHLLGHEEMDMMRPVVFNVPRQLSTTPILSAIPYGTVVSLTWTDTTPASALSTWGNPANEIGFRIERATGTNGTFTVIGTALANTTSYNDTNIDPGIPYRYRVIAFNAAGDSPSNTVTIGAPAAPSKLIATVSVLSANPPTVTLKWQDNSNNESSFIVQRATNANFKQGLNTITVGANVTTLTDTLVQTDTTYYYRVLASNMIGNSAYSNVVSITTPGQLPQAPTNLRSTTIGTNYVILSWIDNSNNEKGFYLERSNDNGTTWTQVGRANANSISFRDNSLTTKTKYLYRIQAYNASGASAYSNTLTVTTR